MSLKPPRFIRKTSALVVMAAMIGLAVARSATAVRRRRRKAGGT